MSPRPCVRRRSRWTPTKIWRMTGKASAIPVRRAEDLRKLVRSRNLELVVAAVRRRFVGAPALKHRCVAKPIALHVVVFHFAHALDAQRLPREVLAGAPSALAARHARRLSLHFRPLPPRVTLERVFTKGRQLAGQLRT